jgi:hypothetical protein
MNITHANEGTINKNSVTIQTNKGRLELYFSYETIISFNIQTFGESSFYDRATTSEYFSRTTSKFQNEICPSKDERTNPEEFKRRLERALNLLSVDLTTLTERGV